MSPVPDAPGAPSEGTNQAPSAPPMSNAASSVAPPAPSAATPSNAKVGFVIKKQSPEYLKANSMLNELKKIC